MIYHYVLKPLATMAAAVNIRSQPLRIYGSRHDLYLPP